MQSTIGTYASHPNLGDIKVSKPISRAAAIIGLLEFLLGVALLVSGTLLHVNDVNADIDISSSQVQYYGLWSAPGPLIVCVFGVIAWLLRRKGMFITFSVINMLNMILIIAQAVFVLPVTFWFKDFLTMSKCRENELDSHGLNYDREGLDSSKRDCNDMYTISRLFIVLSISCIFAIVISIAGIALGFLAVKQMRKDQIELLEGMTNQEFRQMEEKTAMWLENNVRFSTGSTIARSERTVSESGLSTVTSPTTPTTPGYKDKSWV